MKLRRRRFSIRLLMVVVVFIAADFAIVRAIWDFSGLLSPGVAVVALPFINLLLLGAPGLRAGSPSRRFWIGFEVAGWPLMMLVAVLVWLRPDFAFFPIWWLGSKLKFPTETAANSFAIACAVAMYTPPQVLIAGGAGWVSSRYRVVIEKRSGM